MRNKILRSIATLTVLFSLAATPVLAKTSIEEVESEPAPAMIDVMLIRPLGLVMLGVSSALFVPAAGITAITRPDQMDLAYDAFIRKPARFVFVDPIGSH